MEDLCRLCLSFSNKTLYKFSDDPSIILRIQSCFALYIDCNQSLPNQICILCLNQVNETCEFKRKITENQDTLLGHLRNENGINNFYLQLRNKVKIKQEPDTLNFAEPVPVKSEVSIIIKPEIQDTPEDLNTSDDEVLSNLKEEKPQTENKTEVDVNPFLETYKCLTCFQELDTQLNLIQHYKSVHYIKKESDNNKEYTIEVKDNSKTYKCSLCPKEYRSIRYIRRHLVAHSDQRPYLCKMCGRTYKTVSDIIRHGRVHSDSKLFCSYKCGYSTAYYGALRAHERRHDKTGYKYKCEECGKAFEVRTWYEQHLNLHSGLKPYVCDICGIAFHMNKYLGAHRTAVHPQSCDLKRFMCVHCSLPCDSKKSLTEHLEVHGLNRKCLCDQCGKTLSNPEQLKIHKRRHTGVKPFSCSTCDKAFTKKYNLQLHQRTHTGERTYPCVHCGRKYTQKSTLLKHYSRHHPGVEPMACRHCKKPFPSRRILNIHQKRCKIQPTVASESSVNND